MTTIAPATAFGVDGLTVVRGGRRVLDEVTCEVAAGGITAVVGGDGAGKTTLLRVFAGTVEPDGGDVRRPADVRTGALLESVGVHADLTVDENLDFVAAAYGVTPRERRERGAELLDRVGLTAAADRLGGALSGGMRQKLAVALALLHRPTLVVLDEPTTGVDPVSRADMWRMLAAAASEDVAILLSTTYLDEAERAGHIVLLHEGRVLLSGDHDRVMGAVGGRFGTLDHRPEDVDVAWRRARAWRCWVADGPLPPGAREARPTFEDVAIAAQVAGGSS